MAGTGKEPRNLWAMLLIACLGTISYSNSFNCSFHFDDFGYIVDNSLIRNIHHLLNNWEFYPCRFITFLSLAINYHFNGLNVFGYHLFNLSVHLISAILVWWLTFLTLSTPVMKGNTISPHARLISLFAGLIFVSHPLQTEAITYIWQRASSLAALFYLASLCFYIRSRSIPSSPVQKLYYICSLLAAILAMFTKENAISLPLMILFFEISFLGTKKNLDLKYLTPFLLTVFIIPGIIYLTRSGKFLETQGFIAQPEIPSPFSYLLSEPKAIVTYIRLLFLPLNQNIDHDLHLSKSIFEWPTFLCILLLAGIFYEAKLLFAKYRVVAFSIFWFFLTLLPESSLWPLKDLIFEHRLYLPMVGYSIFLASGMYYILGKYNLKAMIAILMVVISFNSILTYQRNFIWKDGLTLWNDAVSKSPHKARPYNGLGIFYSQQGELTEALSNFNRAIEINPFYADAYNARGSIYSRMGNSIYALSDYNTAIKINPKFAEAYYNRAIFYEKQGNLPQAQLDYNITIELNPNLKEPYYNIGNTYAKEGNFNQAINYFTKAIAIDPDYAKAYNNLGNIYGQRGDTQRALFNFNKAVEINPVFVEALSNRAFIHFQLKEYTLALADAHKAQSLGGILNPYFIHALMHATGDDK